MASFPHLTRPGRIGSLELKNRMLVAAMGVNLAEPDGSCGERIIAYHERQARGGAGLIVMGVTGVMWPRGRTMPLQTAISEDRHIPGLRAVAAAAHRHGARLAAQLHHGGPIAAQDSREGHPLWVPSRPPPTGRSDLGEGMLPEEMAAFHDPDAPPATLHVMTREDIDTLVRRFAEAAERARRADFDALELHAGHGYCLSAFLSPALNQRDDDYGGSLENRARLLLEIIAAVRERAGRDFPLWVKLDSEEFGRSEGITLADAKAVAGMAESAGADAIGVSAYHDPGQGWLHSESNIPHVPERLVDNARAIRRAVGIPVIAAGRIEADSADRHIGRGHFDFLGLGRKLLADPDLPGKLAAGSPRQVRPCIYCYCCVSQIYLRKRIRCAVNPETGGERELLASDSPRHVAVVGGGPGGMEAARRLALRGHRVTLLESGARLGGALRLAGIAYEPNERLLDWLRLQIRQAPVAVRLNTRASPELLRGLGVERVVVATGARRDMPDIPGGDRDFVFSGEELRALALARWHPGLDGKTGALTRLLLRSGALAGLAGKPALARRASRWWLPLGRRIGIVGGELVGLELAEFLAERGREVTVLEGAPRAGQGLYLVRRLRLLHELRRRGATLVERASEIAIGERRIGYRNCRGQRRHIDVDQVIVARGARGDTSLAERLAAEGFRVHAIGDCTGVGYIEGAMRAAAEVAAEI